MALATIVTPPAIVLSERYEARPEEISGTTIPSAAGHSHFAVTGSDRNVTMSVRLPHGRRPVGSKAWMRRKRISYDGARG